MVMYYIEAEPNRERAIKYIDLDVSSLGGISSQPIYELNVCFALTRSITLRSQDSSDPLGSSHDLALLNTTCELSFENSNQERIIHLRPTQDARLYLNGNTIFSTRINPQDAEHLNAWRNGKAVLLKWRILGYVAVIDSSNARSLPIFWLDVSNKSDNRNALPSLDTNAFTSKILTPLKLSNNFIEEFPLEIPDVIKKTTGLPPGISGLQSDLYLLAEHLNSAVEVIRNAKTGYDYRHVMDEVKSSLDSIRNYKNKNDLGKELLVETGIIGNTDPNAGNLASGDVMDKFFKIMDNAYWIASKPAHTKLKGSSLRFSMNPDKTEAIFVLTVALASARFLIQRIEHYIATRL
jgi:hypothetical protein